MDSIDVTRDNLTRPETGDNDKKQREPSTKDSRKTEHKIVELFTKDDAKKKK